MLDTGKYFVIEKGLFKHPKIIGSVSLKNGT